MNPAVQAVICGRRRQLTTRTFTANATWTAPVTTSRIESAVGRGADGSPSTPQQRQVMVTSLSSPSSGTGPSPAGSYDWNTLQGGGGIAANKLNAGGSGIVINTANLAIYPNGTFSYTTGSTTISDNVIAGSASVVQSGGWRTSGAISYGEQGNENVNYSYAGGSTNGADTTAFGKTFPGGIAGPATTTTFNNVAITPGATYNIVVPAGGSVTITYFQ